MSEKKSIILLKRKHRAKLDEVCCRLNEAKEALKECEDTGGDGTADVKINNVLFGTAPCGGSINVPTEYADGTPIGTILGGKVIIPNPPTSLSKSQLFLYSTASLENPLSGDLLWFDLKFISKSGNLLDPEATIIEYKRDGVVIPLLDDATNYMIWQADIGSTLSLEVTPVEFGGTVQDKLTITLGSVVSGSSHFSYGDMQAIWAIMLNFKKNVEPFAQPYIPEDANNLFKTKSMIGNGINSLPYTKTNSFEFDPANLWCYGGAAQRSFFNKALPNFTGTTWGFYAVVKLNGAQDTPYFFRDMGVSKRSLHFHRINQRLDFWGLRTPNGSVLPDDEVAIIIRCSDDLFTTNNGVANRRTDIWIGINRGGVHSELWVESTVNYMNGQDFNYGWKNTVDLKIETLDHSLKAWGMTSQFIDNAQMDGMQLFLKTL